MRLPVGRVSIRFEVRGGSRPYPLTRRSDKPCCGVLHATPSRSSGWLPEPARNGVKPLVRCHAYLKPFWSFSNTPVRGCLQNTQQAAGSAGFLQPYPHAIPSRDGPVTQGSANSVAWVV